MIDQHSTAHHHNQLVVLLCSAALTHPHVKDGNVAVVAANREQCWVLGVEIQAHHARGGAEAELGVAWVLQAIHRHQACGRGWQVAMFVLETGAA